MTLAHDTARPRLGVLLILGPSGSGKGTVAERLLQEGVVAAHLSMGDLLRDLLKRVRHDPAAQADLETRLGGATPEGFGSRVAYLEHAVQSGLLIPDAWTQAVMEHELRHRPELRTRPWVLDGYPRRGNAAQHLLGILQSAGIPVLGVVHLRLPLETTQSRLLARGRADDTPEAIARRYGFYLESVLPTLEFLRRNLGANRVWDVDASDSPEVVYQRVRALVLGSPGSFTG